MKRFVLVMALLSVAMAQAEPVLIVEVAPEESGPWEKVLVGPESLDLRGGIVWGAAAPSWRFVRVRVVESTE